MVLSILVSACATTSEPTAVPSATLNLQGRVEASVQLTVEASQHLQATIEAASSPTPATVEEVVESLLEAGDLLERMGQYQRTIQDYDEAIRINPQFAEAYVGLALSYNLLDLDVRTQQYVDRAAGLGVDRAELEEKLRHARTLLYTHSVYWTHADTAD